MPNLFDQFAKQIGRAALDPSGITVVHDEISPEPQQADLRHEPDPARAAERERLGLLGRIASVVCLIEIFSRTPDAEEFRGCLAKHIAFWQGRARQARAHRKAQKDHQQPRELLVDPFLWIITAGTPISILTKLKLEAAPGWPAGVYFFGHDLLRVGIIAASELPRNRSTLLVRLMAAGRLLGPAIRDLAALPPNAHERVATERILVNLEQALRRQPSPTDDEQEFFMAMYTTFEEMFAEARAEARAETRADAVLTVLRVRGIPVPDAAREHILAEKDAERLKRWHERAIVATAIRDVIDDA